MCTNCNENLNIPIGATGPAGPTGLIGPQGPQGPIGVTGNGVLFVKRTLTSAEILNSFSAPIQIVAAPGVGFALQVIKCMAKINYNSVIYATNVRLRVGCTTLLNHQEEFPVLLLSTINIMQVSHPVIPTTNQLQVVENTGLAVHTTIGNPTAGNSTVDIYVTYIIITL